MTIHRDGFKTPMNVDRNRSKSAEKKWSCIKLWNQQCKKNYPGRL